MCVNSPTGETHTAAAYLGEPATATPLPSKHRASVQVTQQSNTFLATDDQLGHHPKPSSLRGRVEVVHASNEPNSGDGNHERRVNDTREEDLVRQVERLMAENGALRDVMAPPPYTDGGVNE
jgi:hypothetical protein